jgi:geranylgeranyl diphosphate synthase type I
VQRRIDHCRFAANAAVIYIGRLPLFDQFRQRYADELDAAISRVLAMAPGAPDLSVMLNYPLGRVDEFNQPYDGSTGKRIRPLFLLLCTEAAGGDWRKAVYAAAAVELLHNFSLIHDDIQDDSPLRHNRPTVWKIWGIANAINAGDLLFSLAFVALQQLSTTGLPPKILIEIWAIFNRTNLELTRGQHLDMRFERQPTVTIDEYLSMIKGKSAALLATCAQIGALIASHDFEMAERYGDFALNLGVAFQIRDDILGIWGDEAVTGKSTATDILSKKKSLPVLYGLERSVDLVAIYQQDHLQSVDVERAVSELERCGAQDYAREVETTYYNAALAALRAANSQGPAADGLRRFVSALFNRVF